MSDRPILFSGPMVRAILDGRKTQTRRAIDIKRYAATLRGYSTTGRLVAYDGDRHGLEFVHDELGLWNVESNPKGRSGWYVPVRFNVGQRLWVRETHYVWSAGYRDGTGRRISYRATEPDAPTSWTPSIHMPRWASRLTLTVTAVKVERLQDISEEDAMAEGAVPILVPPDGGSCPHVEGFRDLWNSIHGKDAWDANPWCAAITFTAEQRNIDQPITDKAA